MPLEEKEYPTIYEELSFLLRRTGIAKAQIFLLKEQSPNAFAVALGRKGKHAIFITEGALSLLSKEEMRALFSLCLAQIKFKRFLLAPALALLVFPIAKLSSFLPIFFSFPLNILCSLLVSTFMQKTRLFLVDAYGKAILGSEDNLANTMRKMHSMGRKVPLEWGHIAFDHLFLFPAHPAKEHSLLWDTQPPMEERIEEVLRLSPRLA